MLALSVPRWFITTYLFDVRNATAEYNDSRRTAVFNDLIGQFYETQGRTSCDHASPKDPRRILHCQSDNLRRAFKIEAHLNVTLFDFEWSVRVECVENNKTFLAWVCWPTKNTKMKSQTQLRYKTEKSLGRTTALKTTQDYSHKTDTELTVKQKRDAESYLPASISDVSCQPNPIQLGSDDTRIINQKLTL